MPAREVLFQRDGQGPTSGLPRQNRCILVANLASRSIFWMFRKLAVVSRT